MGLSDNMAATTQRVVKRKYDGNPGDGHPPDRKQLRLADLPISPAKREALDGLVNTFKKQGEFDVIRKHVYRQFESSVRWPVDVE